MPLYTGYIWRICKTLYYEICGKGNPIFLLHGWGVDSTVFAKIAKGLSSFFTVVSVDFYGFGKSKLPPHPLTLDDYVKGLKEIIDKCGFQDIVLLGHSFGGRVAIKTAVYDSRVVGVVLVDSAGIKPKRGIGYFSKILSYKLRRLFRLDISSCGSEDYKKLSPMEKITFINIVNEDLSQSVSKITVPTLLIWGSNDTETPLYMAKKLKKRISKSKEIFYEKCGHFPFLEKPSRFTEDVIIFCSELFL